MTLPPEDPVDEALHRGGYLDDGGFTARVLGGLPPPRRGRSGLALGLALGGAVAGAAIGTVVLLGPGAPLLAAAAAWLAGAVAPVGLPAAALGAVAGLAATGLLIAFAD